MTRLFASLALALTLCACTIPGLGSIGTAPPAPLAATTADEKGLTIAFLAYDAVLDLVELRVDRGELTGERAGRVRDKLKTAWALLNAARDGQAALSAASYAELYKSAIAAISDARDAIKGA